MDSINYKSLAIRQGIDPNTLIRRPLTWEQYSTMSEPEKSWHLSENSKACDKAFADHEKEVRDAASHAKREVRKIVDFDVEDVPALANLMIENGGKFSSLYPQFIESRKNTDRVLLFLKENELLPDVENFAVAFKALAHAGDISIDASKTGLTDDNTELTGERLQDALNSNPLLLSKATPDVVERRRLMRMPTKDFEAHQEKTNPKPLPYAIKQQIDLAFRTLESRHPEFRFNSDSNKDKLLAHLNAHASLITAQTVEAAFVALKQAGELDLNPDVRVQAEHATWTGYEQIEGKTYTEKQESLRRKINRMTDPEFVEFVNHSPANRRAVDSL